MNHSLRRTICLAAALCALTPANARSEEPASAAAVPSPDERARELKRRADDAMEALRFADALAGYSEAYGISRDPALLYNKARALEALGEYAQAIDAYERFEQVAPPELKARVAGLRDLIAELRRRIATLTIHCDTKGAAVRLRDRPIGVIPMSSAVVNAGHALLEVTAEGYYPYKREIDLPGAGALTLDVRLSSKQTAGALIVESPVSGARVSVDGRSAGTAPIETIASAGLHEIRVEHDGYVPTSTTVIVPAGGDRRVSIPLERVTPITAKWWFWTGVGAVVLGGAALTAALLTERSAGHGSIAPGQVGLKLTTF